MLQELKRHKNKHKPVYLIADEATNFKLHDLASLMTWGRGYGLRLHLILQSLSAFKKTYGPDALNVALSESEIVQVLPGQREPDTLKLLETRLGQRGQVIESMSGNRERAPFGVDSASLSETSRPLMFADEIRQTDKAILFIRRNRPALVDLPSVASIHPWRDQIGINPFHGKPYRLPIRLRIRR